MHQFSVKLKQTGGAGGGGGASSTQKIKSRKLPSMVKFSFLLTTSYWTAMALAYSLAWFLKALLSAQKPCWF